MLKHLRQKFAAMTAPPSIDVEYRSLAEENKDWEKKSFPTMDDLRAGMAYFITGQFSQPWGYIIRNAKLNELDLNNLNKDRSNLVSKKAAQFVMLGGSTFENVQMRDARMQGVYFWGSKFTQCDLTRAQMPGADFRSDQIRYFMYMMNPFQQSHPFGKTELTNVCFHEAELRRANFKGAILKDIDFTGADLRNADFTGVDVSTCCFDGANVTGAVFTRTLVKPGTFANANGRPDLIDGMNAATLHRLKYLRVAKP